MPHAYQAKYAEDGDPTPTLLSRDEMVAKLTQGGVHPDSPMGRGVLLVGDIFADDSGQTFTTPSTLRQADEPVAARSPVTHRSAQFAKPDNGDLVCAAMGLTPPGATQSSQQPAARTPPAAALSTKSNMQLVCEAMGLTLSKQE